MCVVSAGLAVLRCSFILFLALLDVPAGTDCLSAHQGQTMEGSQPQTRDDSGAGSG